MWEVLVYSYTFRGIWHWGNSRHELCKASRTQSLFTLASRRNTHISIKYTNVDKIAIVPTCCFLSQLLHHSRAFFWALVTVIQLICSLFSNKLLLQNRGSHFARPLLTGPLCSPAQASSTMAGKRHFLPQPPNSAAK